MEVQERGDACIPMDDSLCGRAETNSVVKPLHHNKIF